MLMYAYLCLSMLMYAYVGLSLPLPKIARGCQKRGGALTIQRVQCEPGGWCRKYTESPGHTANLVHTVWESLAMHEGPTLHMEQIMIQKSG